MLRSVVFGGPRPADSFTFFSTVAPPAVGPYSQAVKVGNMLYISGCIPLNLEGEVVGPGDIRKQVVQVLANLKAVTEAGGSQVGKIIKTIVSFPGNLANVVNLYGFSTGVP